MDLLYPPQHCIGGQLGRDQVTSLHLVGMKERDRFYPDVLESFDSPMMDLDGLRSSVLEPYYSWSQTTVTANHVLPILYKLWLISLKLGLL